MRRPRPLVRPILRGGARAGRYRELCLFQPGSMVYEGDFRGGDVLSVACPFTPTRGERGVKWDDVAVWWPWWRIDTDSDFVHWNGIVGLEGAGLRT